MKYDNNKTLRTEKFGNVIIKWKDGKTILRKNVQIQECLITVFFFFIMRIDKLALYITIVSRF